MFQYKVSIYMKSGNKIRFRLYDYEFSIDNHKQEFSFRKKIINKYKDIIEKWESIYVDKKDIDGIIVKRWWQRWG